jgi:hypothetical protein
VATWLLEQHGSKLVMRERPGHRIHEALWFGAVASLGLLAVYGMGLTGYSLMQSGAGSLWDSWSRAQRLALPTVGWTFFLLALTIPGASAERLGSGMRRALAGVALLSGLVWLVAMAILAADPDKLIVALVGACLLVSLGILLIRAGFEAPGYFLLDKEEGMIATASSTVAHIHPEAVVQVQQHQRADVESGYPYTAWELRVAGVLLTETDTPLGAATVDEEELTALGRAIAAFLELPLVSTTGS